MDIVSEGHAMCSASGYKLNNKLLSTTDAWILLLRGILFVQLLDKLNTLVKSYRNMDIASDRHASGSTSGYKLNKHLLNTA